MNRKDPTFSPSWRRDLSRAGFHQADSTGPFRLNGLTFEREDGWPTLRSSRSAAPIDESAPAGDGSDGLGRAGLWKSIRAAEDPGSLESVFDLPPAAVSSEDVPLLDLPADAASDASGTSALACALGWALATEAGEHPAGWTAPEREIVESWIPPGGLTARSGSFLRQGSLVVEPARLVLRFVVFPAISPDLSATRKLWLEHLLHDAHARWRVVRTGFSAGGIVAEVDLSGAPPAILEPLFKYSLAALRCVVEWIGPHAAFIADTSVPSVILDSVNPRNGQGP